MRLALAAVAVIVAGSTIAGMAQGDEPSVGHVQALPGDGYSTIARRLAPDCDPRGAEIAALWPKVSAANGNRAIRVGEWLHYTKEDVPSCPSSSSTSTSLSTTSSPPSTSTTSTTSTSTATTSTTSTPVTTTSTSPPPSSTSTTLVPPSPATFTETFSGQPSSPFPFRSEHWDVVVHSRDTQTWDQLETSHAQHTDMCGAPNSDGSATHPNSSYDGAVFLCRDHVMTSIRAGGYGVIYLTPDAMMDWSTGESVLRFDVSTLVTSARDWWDIWVTDFDANMVLPLDQTLPDLTGEPAGNFVNARMNFRDGHPIFDVYVNGAKLPSAWWVSYDDVLTQDAARRDTFELRISEDRVKFSLLDGNGHDGVTWVDEPVSLPDGWSQGVVQIGHHSYNPFKDDCPPLLSPCSDNTWHWDNVSIEPASPFTIVHADSRIANAADDTVVFDVPAPAGGHLRFAGIGLNLQVSFDGGATWSAAVRQASAKPGGDEHFKSYWQPIPAGTTTVKFRGQNWFAGQWRVNDVTVWSAAESLQH